MRHRFLWVCAVLCAVLCAVPAGMAQGTSPSIEQHLLAAKRAQAQQDCHTAAREYGMAVRLRPDSGELRSNEGIALYCDGQMDAAIATLQKAESLNPSLIAPHLFLGLAWNRTAEYTKSAKELETAVRLNVADPTAHLWLGYTYAAQSHFESAVAQFEETLKLDPVNTDAQYARGQSYLELGREAAKQLRATAPNEPWLLQLAGEQDELSGNTTEAKAAFAEAARRRAALPASNASDTARQEALYQQAHDAELKARDAFQALLQQAPSSYRAHEVLADIDAARQQREQAVQEYRTVLQLNPELPGMHESISYCLMLDGRFAEALDELRAEEKLQPRSAQVKTEIGRMQLDAGDDSGAITSLRTALSLQNAPLDASVLLGKALLRAGDTKGAIKQLELAVSRDASAPLPYYLLARAYRSTGDRAAMNKALSSFRGLSQDEAERQAMERATQNPNRPPPLLTAQDVQDAKTLAAPNP